MHTFLKSSEGYFKIGMWLPNSEGRTSFMTMARVQTLVLALQTVNYLNGGDGDRNITVTNHLELGLIE